MILTVQINNPIVKEAMNIQYRNIDHALIFGIPILLLIVLVMCLSDNNTSRVIDSHSKEIKSNKSQSKKRTGWNGGYGNYQVIRH